MLAHADCCTLWGGLESADPQPDIGRCTCWGVWGPAGPLLPFLHWAGRGPHSGSHIPSAVGMLTWCPQKMGCSSLSAPPPQPSPTLNHHLVHPRPLRLVRAFQPYASPQKLLHTPGLCVWPKLSSHMHGAHKSCNIAQTGCGIASSQPPAHSFPCRDNVMLLNRLTEVINFWQDSESKHTIEEARAYFPDCAFM